MEFFERITENQRAFIAKQSVFFVATAAHAARINLSPKGMDSFRVLSDTQVGYLDVGGSGNETHAHLSADGRITVMMCAFNQPALILRIYGRGRAVLPQDDGWAVLAEAFTILPGTRQIFVINIDSIQESCGWGVPFMTLDRERKTLSKYHAAQDPDERLAKISERTQSIDSLLIRVQTLMPNASPLVLE
jgi:Pyridoxamine 5'-phosphate oxidase